jgi:MinD-like ATPase involved in chromosome partitioning or flagellar assembly
VALVTLASVRSCGATTLASGLAMTWPGDRRTLLVEADPAGGTLAAQAGLGPEPGLVSLAAAARRAAEPSLVFEHAQLLPGEVRVVCGPPAAARARSALSMLSGLLSRLGDLDAAVLCDCGRLDPATSGVEVFGSGDLAVLVARPRLSDLSALAALLDEGAEHRERPLLVLVGDGPYPAKEVAEVLDVQVVGHVPWDREAAESLATAPLSSRQLTRTPLVRALRSLANELAGRLQGQSPDGSTSASARRSRGGDTALAVGS